MAARYWVGGSGTWDTTTTHWSASSGGAAGASAPTSADDVYFDSASNATSYTVSIGVGISVNCLNLSINNPASGAVTIAAGSNASRIQPYGTSVFISEETLITGNPYMRIQNTTASATINISLPTTQVWGSASNTYGIRLGGTSGQTYNFLTGFTCYSLSTIYAQTKISFTGTVNLSSNFIVAGAYNITTIDATGATINCGGSFNPYCTTLTLTNATLSCASFAHQSVPTTVNSSGSTINCSGNFSGNGKTYNIVNLTGTSCALDGANTFATLTRSNAAAFTTTLSANQTITGVFTGGGTSLSTYASYLSSVAGTQRTIALSTTGSWSGNNVSWTDISFTGTNTPISGTGFRTTSDTVTTGITYPTTLYWVGGAGNFTGASMTTHWSDTSGGPENSFGPTGSSTITYPTWALPNLKFDVNSGSGNYTVTDSSRYGVRCKDYYLGNPSGGTLTYNVTQVTGNIYGSYYTEAGISYPGSQGGVYFYGTGSHTITTNGVTFFGDMGRTNNITFAGTGTYTLTDDLNTKYHIVISNGNFNTAGYAFNTGSLYNLSISSTGTVTFNNSTITTQIFTNTSSTATFTGSTINMTGAGTFAGNGKTYGTVNLTGNTATITGANTFTNLTRTGTAAASTMVVSGANQTVTGTLTINGNSATNYMSLSTDVAGTQRTITCAAFSGSYIWWKDIVIAGAAAPVSGTMFSNLGNNSGITFVANRYWVGGGGTWDTTHTNWAETSGGTPGTGYAPTAFENAFFDGNSGGGLVVHNKTFTTDDRTADGWSSVVSSGSSTVTGGLWQSVPTDGVGYIYKNYTAIGAGSVVRVRCKESQLSGWGSTNSIHFENTVNVPNPGIWCGMRSLSIGGSVPLTFSVNYNGTYVHDFSTGLQYNTWYEMEAEFTGTSYIFRLYADDGVTLVDSYTYTLSTVYPILRILNHCTTASSRYIDFVNASIQIGVTRTATTDVIDLSFNGYTGTFAGSAALGIKGSLTLGAGMTNSFTGAITFSATTTGKTITSNGKSFSSAIIFGTAAGGGWTLQDDFVTTGGVTLSYGALSTGGKNMSFATFTSSVGNTRSWDISNSIITTSAGGGAYHLNILASGFTITSTNSEIIINAASTYTRVVLGTGKQYNKITVQGGIGLVIFNYLTTTGVYNNITTLNIDASVSAKSIGFVRSSESVSSNIGEITTIGPNAIQLGPVQNTGTSYAAVAWVLNKVGGGSCTLYGVYMYYCTATPTNAWYCCGGRTTSSTGVVPTLPPMMANIF